MGDEKKPCPECGNKLNYSRADEIYLCPYCGEEFAEHNEKLTKKRAAASAPKQGMTADEMKDELDSVFADSLLGRQLSDDRDRKARKKDESHLLDLRMRATEARRMTRVANRTGISLCVFFDFVIFALAYNYDVLAYGLGAMALLTLGTYFYLSSYATKVKKWEERIASETREIEKDLYLEELNKELDEDEGLKE